MPEVVVQYPTSIDNDASLLKAVDRVETFLTAQLNVTGMTVHVISTALFPDVGYLSIDDEIIFYTSKTATQFNAILRGAQFTTPATHSTNANVNHNVIAIHHNILKDAVIAIENELGADVKGSYNSLSDRLNNILVYVPEYQCMITG